jgi:hypothetical protein
MFDRRQFVQAGSALTLAAAVDPSFAQKAAEPTKAAAQLPGLASKVEPKASPAPAQAPAVDVIKPRHVLCFLGNWKSAAEADIIVRGLGRGFELDKEFSSFGKPDERMLESFKAAADRTNPSMTDEDWKAIEGHTSVAYVLSPFIERDKAVPIGIQTMVVMSNFLKGGKAVALKHESSGLAHGKARWLTMLDRAKAAKGEEVLAPLVLSTVRRPIVDKDKALYSCGAHLLGVRDIEVLGMKDEMNAVQLMDQLIAAQVKAGPTAPPPESMRAGPMSKPMSISLSATKRYGADELFFNPWGYLRVRA